jgi:hypothetical protein
MTAANQLGPNGARPVAFAPDGEGRASPSAGVVRVLLGWGVTAVNASFLVPGIIVVNRQARQARRAAAKPAGPSASRYGGLACLADTSM